MYLLCTLCTVGALIETLIRNQPVHLHTAHRAQKDKPGGGAETSVWQAQYGRPLSVAASRPADDEPSDWSGEPTNQERAKLAGKTLPRTRAVCTQQSEAGQSCCCCCTCTDCLDIQWTLNRDMSSCSVSFLYDQSGEDAETVLLFNVIE